MAEPVGDRSEIVFFDLEATRTEHGFVIVEFGAILVDSRTLVEVEDGSFYTLVRPADSTHFSSFVNRSNGITKEALDFAPTFKDIADHVYDLLHGRIWAGHNIEEWDCDLIRKAFKEIGRVAPEPKGTFDCLKLLRSQRFGDRAGDKKVNTVATFFGLGEPKHRSLEDVRMNIEVLKCCATVLLMESTRPDLFPTMDFLKPDDISLTSISATHEPDGFWSQKIQIKHRDVPLKLSSADLNIRFGIGTKFVDDSGRQRLHFVVYAPPSLCQILDTCDHCAREKFLLSGVSSEWHPVVIRREGFYPTLRLRLPTVVDGDVTHLETEIYRKDSWGFSSRFNVMYDQLESLFIPGDHVDAYFSLDTYNYKQHAGIRLVAERLILHD